MSVHKPPPLDPDGQPIPQKYDPGDFIVSPVDTRGVSYRVTFRVMPEMERALDQVIASNRFPFTTRGDVLRFCVREGLRVLEHLEPVISVSKRIDFISAQLNDEADHAEFLHVFDHLAETVNQYLADQAPDQAARVIALTKHHFECMPDGYWRERYLRELHKRFASFLEGKAGAPLLPEGTGNGHG